MAERPPDNSNPHQNDLFAVPIHQECSAFCSNPDSSIQLGISNDRCNETADLLVPITLISNTPESFQENVAECGVPQGSVCGPSGQEICADVDPPLVCLLPEGEDVRYLHHFCFWSLANMLVKLV